MAVALHACDSLLRRRITAVLQEDGISVVLPSDGPPPPADVVVLHQDLPRVARVVELRLAVEEAGELPVVILSSQADGPSARRAVMAGARGLVFIGEMDTALAPTVRAVAANQTCFPRSVRLTTDKPALSHREREVLKLAVSGRTNFEIAAALCLAESTVKCHLSAAFHRLGVGSRREAATLVLDPEEGLRAIVLGTNSTAPGHAEATRSSNGA